MLALRMSSIRSIPAISSAETNSPSPPFALSLSLRFPLRPFLRLLKAAYLPCWSFSSESRRGMPGGSEEGPSDSRRASLLPYISGACHAPIGPCPAEGAHCAPPSLSPLGAYRSLSRGLSASLSLLSLCREELKRVSRLLCYPYVTFQHFFTQYHQFFG